MCKNLHYCVPSRPVYTEDEPGVARHNPSFVVWRTCHAEPGFIFSMRHFGNLFHSTIKTRRNRVRQPTFTDIMTELIQFFRSLKKKFSLWPLNDRKNKPSAEPCMVQNYLTQWSKLRITPYNSWLVHSEDRPFNIKKLLGLWLKMFFFSWQCHCIIN